MVVTIAAIVAQQVNLSLLPGEAAGVTTRWAYYTVPLTFAPFFALGILAHRTKLRASIANFAGAMVGFLIICAYSSVIPFDMFRSSVSYVLLTGISFITVTLAFNSIVPPAVGALVGSRWRTELFDLPDTLDRLFLSAEGF